MNVLHLYDKARNQGLDAQELEWIEQATRENPYFGLAYQISARHHLAEKTTVKDRALLLGAAYACDRNLLHSYVSDTLAAPKHAKGVSIVQPVVVEPVVVAPVPVEAEAVEVAHEETVEVPQPEHVIEHPEAIEVQAADPVEASAAPAADPVELLSEVGTVAEELPTIDALEAVEETLSAEPVVSALSIVAPAIASQPESTVDILLESKDKEENTAPVREQAVPLVAKAYPQVGINWFLNMRLKLKASRYTSMSDRIRSSITTHAAKDSSPATQAVESKAIPEIQAPVVVEYPKAKAGSQPIVPIPVPEKEKPVAENPDKAPRSGQEYAIGAFSSFTFLRDDDSQDANETEMEALVMEPESMAVEASLAEDRSGEMIFEEDGRRVEIVISPELRERFFHGRMFELNTGNAEPSVEKETSQRVVPKEVPPASQVASEADRRKKAQELMNRFIEVDPTMPKLDAAKVAAQDLGKDSSVDRDDWVTETLAKIYAQQGNKSKAIKIYQKLSLLFPEKRDYFASRIAELK